MTIYLYTFYLGVSSLTNFKITLMETLLFISIKRLEGFPFIHTMGLGISYSWKYIYFAKGFDSDKERKERTNERKLLIEEGLTYEFSFTFSSSTTPFQIVFEGQTFQNFLCV